MSRKIVQLTVDVVFDGDYYDADEIVPLGRTWIMGAFDDQDDVVPFSLTVTGTVDETTGDGS